MDKKARPIYMPSTRDPPQNKRFPQVESKGMEKNTPCKWKWKKSSGSNTYILQNRLQNKVHKKRQRRSLHNTIGINPTRGRNPCKYICTQYKST